MMKAIKECLRPLNIHLIILVILKRLTDVKHEVSIIN